ncbi:hypothetical protein E3N88_08302 [Mikania micrantha]|uniref:RING-type domain-containing protein n=1 Tax=Mikania micrantha TaxID=192012 RepID=A0A5N6PGT3_9ASTR|nr:hypothetical protein E3N88_08302 [Mikania micrantha]
MADFQIRVLMNVIMRIFTAMIICTGGAVIGIVTGAIRGLTMETGLARGAAVGAVSGAIIALQAVDMIANGEPFSKVALLHGELFIEWTSAMETSFTDIFDMENSVTRGLSKEVINDLPKHVFEGLSKTSQKHGKCYETNCVICLENFKNKEEGRELPICKHVFHIKCIDEWLIRQGSCPICRQNVIV